ncbi:tetratricopeptide repeat protein [Aquirufa sp.]|jgi:tetratricopeptide (TPR) repeat protein|uniref:tetratricopeptide repeat protein n=1 Tax=Aquirufa sp. TaxID=2676249 RepID=UPI0037BE5996
MRFIGILLVISLLFACQSEYNLGIRQLKKGQYKEAVESFNFALDRNPRNSDIYFARGLSRGFLDNHLGAIADLTRAIKLDENQPNYYFYRAYFKSLYGNNRGSIDDFSRAIDLEPYWPEAYYNRGVKLVNIGLFDEACSDFETAKYLGDTLSNNYLNLYCRPISSMKKEKN